VEESSSGRSPGWVYKIGCGMFSPEWLRLAAQLSVHVIQNALAALLGLLVAISGLVDGARFLSCDRYYVSNNGSFRRRVPVMWKIPTKIAKNETLFSIFHSSVVSTITDAWPPALLRGFSLYQHDLARATSGRAPLFVLLTPRDSSQITELAADGPTTSKCMLFVSSPRASSHLPTRSNSTDTNDVKSKPLTDSIFVTALVLNGAIAGVEIAVFTLVRRYFPFIYEPRSSSVFGAYAPPLALSCHRLSFV